MRFGIGFDSAKLMGDLISLGSVDLSAEIDLPPIKLTPEGLSEAHLLRDGGLDQRRRIMRNYPRLIKKMAWRQGQRQRPKTDDTAYDEMQDELRTLQHKATGEGARNLDRLARNLELEITKRETLIQPQDGIESRLTESWEDIARGVRPRASQLAGFWHDAEERFRRFLRLHPLLRGIMPEPKPKAHAFWWLLGLFFFVEVVVNFIFLASPTSVDSEARQPGLIELALLPIGFAFINILVAYYGGGLCHRMWSGGTWLWRASAVGVGAAASIFAGTFVLVLAHVRDFVSQGRALSELTVSGLGERIFSSQALDLGFEAGMLCLLTGLLFVVAFAHSQRTFDRLAERHRVEWTRRHETRRRFNQLLEEDLRRPCRALFNAYRDAITHLEREVTEARNPVREYIVRARHESDDLRRRWEDFTAGAAKAIRLYRTHNIEGREARRWFGFLSARPTAAPAYFKQDPGEGFRQLGDNSVELEKLRSDFATQMNERASALRVLVEDLPNKEAALAKFCADYQSELLKEAKLQDHDSDFAGDFAADEDLGDNTIRLRPDRRR